MNKVSRLLRLQSVHPGWEVWNELTSLVESLEFEIVDDKYMGSFLTSGSRLSFSIRRKQPSFPDWLPTYVNALYGMKADAWEMSGGFADCFTGEPAAAGGVFSPAGNDEALGFPLIEVPNDLYPFQSNSSGAIFFVNHSLEIHYPNADQLCFSVLDKLDEFAQKNIRQVIQGRPWFEAYHDFDGSLLD